MGGERIKATPKLDWLAPMNRPAAGFGHDRESTGTSGYGESKQRAAKTAKQDNNSQPLSTAIAVSV